jgi:hypothetical protein
MVLLAAQQVMQVAHRVAGQFALHNRCRNLTRVVFPVE